MTAEALVTVCNRKGLHARAAAKFCTLAASFEAATTVTKDQTTVGGASLMALLMLGAAQGSQLVIRAEGTDADAAVEALSALVQDRFGEED